jgi:hypothetical protein
MNPLSDDASRYAFAGGPTQAAYVRVNGTTHAISVSHRTLDPGVLKSAQLIGTSDDVRKIFILAKDLTDDSPSDILSLYRFTLDESSDGGHLELLTPLGAAPTVTDPSALQVSARGGTVYFQTHAALTPGANAGGFNLYVWHGGQISLVAALTLDGIGLQGTPSWRASPNGRYLVFAAYSKLTDYDPASNACQDSAYSDPGTACREIYRYDADSHQLVCASCRPDGKAPTGNALIGTDRADLGGHAFARSVDDTGRVFFDTPDPLVARDVNSVRDVYAFDGDDVSLISAGRGGSSRLADASLDGNNVFFSTQSQLVAEDTDTATDVYDARVGGGIASQNERAPDTKCSGEDCRSAGAGPTTSDSTPTQALSGTGNHPKSPAKAKISRVTAGFKGTVLRLTLTVSGPGRVRVTGAKVVTAARTTDKAGTYRLQVKLNKKQRALRRKGRSVKAAMTVTFTPVYGASVKSKLTRTAGR